MIDVAKKTARANSELQVLFLVCCCMFTTEHDDPTTWPR
jgi:hypothetical protein